LDIPCRLNSFHTKVLERSFLPIADQNGNVKV